jgi:hypothetical protein
MIRSFAAAAAGYELHDDGWTPGDIFLQEGHESADAQIAGATRIAALDDGNRFALEKRRLGVSETGKQTGEPGGNENYYLRH